MKTFDEIYQGRPDQAEVGSSGYSNLLNLYKICERLKPELIVESGTWKGNSSWLFHHFAPVICHDIQFIKLMWRSPDITYIKEDIGNYDYRGNPDSTLYFFDDHISQEQRLEWCIKNEVKHCVFDDNQPYEIAQTLKNPPSPTLDEIRDDKIFRKVKRYEVLPFLGNRRNFDTRLTYIEL